MAMTKLLWKPYEKQRKQANITRFINFINKKYGLKIDSYDELYNWSIQEIPNFWAAMWDFGGIIASRGYDEVVDDPSRLPGAKWFSGARLNFAENLLRRNDGHTAFIFKGETQQPISMTYAQVHQSVARLAKSLREIGVVPGDRVAAYMPNLIETAIAMLAAASVGAVWCSCATDLGPQAVLDRLGQIEPKVLFTVDGYSYGGKRFSSPPNVLEIVSGIPSLQKAIVVGHQEKKPDISNIPNSVLWDDFLAREKHP